MNFYNKYLKYKNKYFNLKSTIEGGNIDIFFKKNGVELIQEKNCNILDNYNATLIMKAREGDIWRGKDLKNNDVCIKVIEDKISNKSSWLKTIKNHIIAYKNNLAVKIHKIAICYTDSKKFTGYIIMDYIQTTVKKYINSIKNTDDFTKKRNNIMYKVIQLVNKLNHLFIIHNDIHSENIVIKNDNLYLIDFDGSLYTKTYKKDTIKFKTFI